MSRKLFVIVPSLLAVIVVAACSTTPDPPAAPIDDDAIVPNVRIGKLALGIDEATLLKWTGVPERTHGRTYYYFRAGKQELSITFDGDRARYIETRSPRFATADGIRVGSSELEVRAAWGSPTRSREVTHDPDFIQYCFRNGLEADVDAARRTVIAIEVNYRCSVP